MGKTRYQVRRQVKRSVVAVIGFTVLGIGIAMIVLPGPAIIAILLGLSILGKEFGWAKNILEMVKNRIRAVRSSLTRTKNLRETKEG